MRILHVDTQKGFRGGEQQLVWLAEGLKKNGITTAVACIEDELYKRCEELGIQTVKLNRNRLASIFQLANASKDFDIIHAHASHAHTISAFAKLLSKNPLVYTRRVDYKPRDNAITRFKYNLTDRIACVASYVCKILKNYLNIDRLTVIHSSTNINLMEQIDYKKVEQIKSKFKGFKIVGTASALTTQKNIPNLIKAAKLVLKNRNDVIFLVVGDGNLKNELIAMVKVEDISDKFLFVGFKRDIENYIKAFDIFVLPSDYEGLSGAVLNAMLLGVPVVATDAGGVPEVVLDKKTGLLVEKNNPKALAGAIETLLNDKALVDKLTKNAYNFVKENFSVEKMVKKYINLYEELLEEKR